MKKEYQIPISLVLALSVAACAHEPTTVPGLDSAITVTAERRLGPVDEAARIASAIEREMDLAASRASSSSLTATQPDAVGLAAALTSSTNESGASVNRSLLLRTANSLRAMVLLGGLEEGVHVMWWVIFNSPENCIQPIRDFGAKCGGGDGSDLDHEDTAIYWAGAAVVETDGFGLFHARTRMDDEPRLLSQHHTRGPGLTNPARAEVHLVIKYVGRASEDVEELSRQLLRGPDDCFLRVAETTPEASDPNCQGQYRAVYSSSESTKTPRFEL